MEKLMNNVVDEIRRNGFHIDDSEVIPQEELEERVRIARERYKEAKEKEASMEPEPEEEPVQSNLETIYRSFIITEDRIYLSVMEKKRLALFRIHGQRSNIPDTQHPRR